MENEGPNALQPNYMGDSLTNLGIDSLIKNHGVGVAEANPNAAESKKLAEGPEEMKDKLRIAMAAGTHPVLALRDGTSRTSLCPIRPLRHSRSRDRH